MPGQQEYQVGPCIGIEAREQLMMSRYILMRVCGDFQVFCTLHETTEVDDGNEKERYMFSTEIGEQVAPVLDELFPPEMGVRIIG
jgi:hypothetical protein